MVTPLQCTNFEQAKICLKSSGNSIEKKLFRLFLASAIGLGEKDR